MMVQENKTALVQTEIERLVDGGKTDIQEIYTIVCDKYGMQRPAVRRSKSQLVKKLKRRVEVLALEGGRSSVLKARPANPAKLSAIEQRILKILKQRNEEMKFSTLHNYLNAITDAPLIKKKRLTYYLARLYSALLIKLSEESRYKITELGAQHVL